MGKLFTKDSDGANSRTDSEYWASAFTHGLCHSETIEECVVHLCGVWWTVKNRKRFGEWMDETRLGKSKSPTLADNPNEFISPHFNNSPAIVAMIYGHRVLCVVSVWILAVPSNIFYLLFSFSPHFFLPLWILWCCVNGIRWINGNKE